MEILKEEKSKNNQLNNTKQEIKKNINSILDIKFKLKIDYKLDDIDENVIIFKNIGVGFKFNGVIEKNTIYISEAYKSKDCLYKGVLRDGINELLKFCNENDIFINQIIADGSKDYYLSVIKYFPDQKITKKWDKSYDEIPQNRITIDL